MEIKKYPNAVLENYSKILIQLGLVLSLFIVYKSLSYKSYHKPVKGLVGTFVLIDDSEQIVEVKVLPPIQPLTPKPTIPENIVVVQDDLEVEETIMESTETDETEAVEVEMIKDIVVVVEEEEVVEDVPFLVIEDVPVFPGCTGNNKELRACFSDKISRFVLKHFNPALASDLGLPPGSTQKIFVVFSIDSKGYITEIEARAPHKQLQKEAIRVIQMLPQMTPGRQTCLS